MPPKRKLADVSADTAAPKPRKRKVKTNDLELKDYPARNHSSSKYVGAHVSAAGGCDLAPHNALCIGAKAFALFTKSQRKWEGPPLTTQVLGRFPLHVSGKTYRTNEEGAKVLTELGDGKGFDVGKIVPHGSYLVNLAHPDGEKRKKSFDCFVDELQRAEALGIQLFNFHPGSSCGECTREEAITNIATSINDAHKLTKQIIVLLENMANRGNIIGGRFEDLGEVIAQVEDKSRVGVCFDTCHAFAAGYDLRTPEAYSQTMDLFEQHVGFKYLKAMHMNDSKKEMGSCRDLHENIGLGGLGLSSFANLMRDPRLDGLPLILETPMLDGTLKADEELGGGVWRREIKILHLLEQATDDHIPEEAVTLMEEVKEIMAKNAVNKEAKKAAKKSKKSKKETDDDEEEDEKPKRKKQKRQSKKVKEAESSELSDVD